MRLVHPCFLALSACALAACDGTPALPAPPNLCETTAARCVSAPARDVIAVDGDTFELRRLSVSGEERVRLRLIGWDSPETGESAACAAEDALGQKVEQRARALFDAGTTITFLPEGTDRFGRTRAHIYLDGDHIGWLLAKDGLAAPWPPDSDKPDWCLPR